MDEERHELVRKSNAVGDKVQLTVDEVVEEYVGSFGFSQLVQVTLVSLARIFDSHSTLVTIFTDAQPQSWRCIAQDCGGARGGRAASVCGLEPGIWEWSGGNSSSTIAEWGLVCDRRYLAALPASVYFLGSLIGFLIFLTCSCMLTGSAVFGRLADGCLGRKRSVLASCLLTAATIFLTSFSPNIWIYSLLRFANGFSRAGIGICCLVLSTESIGRKWRGQVGQYGFFFFAAGFLSIPLIAYPTRTSWRNLYRVISVLPLLYSILVLMPFVSESPRWLLVRGRNEEALNVLRRYARINGKELPPNLRLLQPFTNEKMTECKGENNTSPIERLWNTRWAVRRMTMVMLTGFGIGFVYYGVQLNVENLNFNLYYTVAINAMMEIPAVFVGSVLMAFTDRRLLFSMSAFLTGVACILCTVFSGKKDSNESGSSSSTKRGSLPQLMIEALGFMAASTAFDVLYIYCVELFPTNVRNFCVSMLRQALMLGASISPLMVVFGRSSPSLSFFVFGFLSIISGLLSFSLPETRNCPLYETLEQQEEEEGSESPLTEIGMELGKNVEM